MKLIISVQDLSSPLFPSSPPSSWYCLIPSHMEVVFAQEGEGMPSPRRAQGEDWNPSRDKLSCWVQNDSTKWFLNCAHVFGNRCFKKLPWFLGNLIYLSSEIQTLILLHCTFVAIKFHSCVLVFVLHWSQGLEMYLSQAKSFSKSFFYWNRPKYDSSNAT